MPDITNFLCVFLFYNLNQLIFYMKKQQISTINQYPLILGPVN
jgi:hypothetical protein